MIWCVHMHRETGSQEQTLRTSSLVLRPLDQTHTHPDPVRLNTSRTCDVFGGYDLGEPFALWEPMFDDDDRQLFPVTLARPNQI
jgi:hypothetical protein